MIYNISSLNTIIDKDHRRILALLSIGTFLEYFDLMLYIHMMLFLNDIFFPPNAPSTALWLSTFTFCSSYILRPFGAIIFGLIGDKIGRKPTIIITTFMMAASCITMANLPTYNKIGITASIIVTICRAIQGMSSIAEFIGAQLYLTETLKPPLRYLGVMLMPIASVLGTTVALFMATKVIANNVNWRYLFWLGAFVAVIGLFARNKLNETKEFLEAKHKKYTIDNNKDYNQIKLSTPNPNTVNAKTLLAIFFMHSAWPVCSYFCYIYCGNILKNNFNYTSGQILNENLILAISNLGILLIVAYYAYKIYPLKLAKILLIPFIAIIFIGPAILANSYNATTLFLVRLMLLLFTPYSELITAISFLHIPVCKRLTYVGLAFALSTSIFYCTAPLALTYMINRFNYWGLTIIALPLSVCFWWSINYFKNLENPHRSK